MIEHGKVRSTVQPEPMLIDEHSVWVHSNITEVSENEFIGFEYDMKQYDKDEYIKLLSEKNQTLEQQLTDTQLALCEIYEGMV